MNSIRNIALAIGAGSVLAFGAAYAQEAKKPDAQAKSKEHRMEHKRGMKHGAMQHAGMKHDCPEEARRLPPTPEHNHQ